MHSLLEALNQIRSFMDAGGPILYFVAILTFMMWTLIFERLWYFRLTLTAELVSVIYAWEERKERKSWNAKQIRRKMIAQKISEINQNMGLIKTLVALCPLLGLLGTVTGMIEVFNIMAVTGGGEAKAMAGGVSKATIPTLAGMVAAISGVFANTYLIRIASRESTLLEDHLTRDH